MQTITSTELRTRSKELINTLLSGKSVGLIHRSKFIGEVSLKKNEEKIMTPEKIKKLKQLARQMDLPKLSRKQMEKNYREHIMKKYGQNLS